ncbi:MAG: tRNA-intron lyase [Candidatus Aenigmatarchaeota archaeon]
MKREIKISLEKDGKFYCFDDFSKEELRKSFIGKSLKTYFELEKEEVLYLMEIRNAYLFEKNKIINIKEFLERFSDERFLEKYLTYRDWKIRGLFITYPNRIQLKNFEKSVTKNYPSQDIDLSNYKSMKIYYDLKNHIGFFFDNRSIELFEKYWFGQYGVYKNIDKGKMHVLDNFEVAYLCHKGFEIFDINSNEKLTLEKIIENEKSYTYNFEDMFLVYKEWRDNGYIVKSGLKFGTHFRIYFPGASPLRKGIEWIHSKHVIHVFPKNIEMQTSELARAIRVAHSVRKTFIMAIPGMKKEDYMKEKTPIDFIVYHRNEKNEVENPISSNPSYIVICLQEDEKISGKFLASALDLADSIGLRLLIAIVDRESSVTYYVANRIELPNSETKYYEIEWFNP